MKKITAFALFLFAVCFGGCNKDVSTNQISNSNSNVQQNSNVATRNEAISPDGKFFEVFTSDSNYFDVVKAIGTPDAETDFAEMESPLPMLLACYGEKNVCVYFVNDRYFQDKGVKSKYNYVGTLRINPSEILHSAKPQYLDLLEGIRGMVKQQWQEAEERTLKSKKK